MSTQAITFTGVSDNWTGTVDVTNADLHSSLSTKDFIVFYNSVQQGAPELAYWAKTSRTVLTYSGTSVDLGTVVEIRRDTVTSMIKQVAPNEIIRATDWNDEHDRHVRWKEEKEEFGLGATNIVAVSDSVYSSSWNGVTTQAPSKNAVYDKIELVRGEIDTAIDDTAFDSSWNGEASKAPSQNAAYDTVVSLLDGTYSTTTWKVARNLMGGRMTPSSTNPYGGSASTTLYYLPTSHGAGFVSLYYGGKWRLYPLDSAVSYNLTSASADTSYDVFLYWSGSVLTLELQAWTSAQSRGANKLDKQDNIFIKYGDATRRYIGCIRTNASKQVGVVSSNGSSNIELRLCNYYNRYRDSLYYWDSASSDATWTKNTWFNIENQTTYGKILVMTDDDQTTGICKPIVEMRRSINLSCYDSVAITSEPVWRFRMLEDVTSNTHDIAATIGSLRNASTAEDFMYELYFESTKLPTGYNGWQSWNMQQRGEVTHTGVFTTIERVGVIRMSLVTEW